MNRSDFQKLARVRLDEAKVLRDGGKFDGAYYLAGYAVECALKAVIAKRIKAEEFPPKPGVVQKYYTHDLAGLVTAAELGADLESKSQDNQDFEANWFTVKRWNENSRYEIYSEDEAIELIEAIEDQTHGVLPWLQSIW